MSYSADRLTWIDELPLLAEIYERGGRPGETYCLVALRNQFTTQQAGWRAIPGAPVFRAIGKKGECAFVVMVTGEPTRGVPPEASRPLCYYDEEIVRVTGIDPTHKDSQVLTPEELKEASDGKDRIGVQAEAQGTEADREGANQDDRSLQQPRRQQEARAAQAR